MDTDKLVALGCPKCVDFREGENPEYRRKPLEAQESLVNSENSAHMQGSLLTLALFG